MPDVTDDLDRVWAEQTKLHRPQNSMYSTFNSGEGFNDTKSNYKYSQIQRRSTSNFQDQDKEGTLKMAGKNTLSFPKRQRFNENAEEAIKEMKNNQSKVKLTSDRVGNFDTLS